MAPQQAAGLLSSFELGRAQGLFWAPLGILSAPALGQLRVSLR